MAAKSKPLTDEQIAYLRSVRDRTPAEGNPRGLVKRWLLTYRWGQDKTHGYLITSLGRRTLAEYEKRNAR